MRLFGVTAAVIAAILLVGGCAGCFYTTQIKTGEVEFTVKSKERVAEDNGGKYLIFTTEDKAYQVTDNILFGETNSSGRYSALEVGETYRCTAIGVRFTLTSTYKNLIDCEPVD